MNQLTQIAEETGRVIMINNGKICGIVNEGFVSGENQDG